MKRDIIELKKTIRRLHGVDSRHVETVPVKETFQGQIIWDGDVEVFILKGHAKASKAYGWTHDDAPAGRSKRHVTVLQVPLLTTAKDAVRAAIGWEHRERNSKK